MPLTKTVSYVTMVGGNPVTNTVSYTAYTLTGDYKSIAQESVYVGGTTSQYEKERTTYSYDAYGNVTTVNRYTNLSGSGTYYTTTYDYTDSDTTRGYDGAFLHSVTTTGVKDADGNNFDGGAGTVAERYEYTDYGQVSAYYDPNGNKTSYTYDLLGAVTAITKYKWNPQTSEYDVYSTESYEYDRGENTTTYTNVLGGELVYDYNGIGLLETVTKKAQTSSDTDVVTESYVYDSLGRVTEAYNAAGETSSCKTVYTYDERGELVDTNATAQDIWRVTVETYSELGLTEYLPALKKQLIDSAENVGEITDWLGW